MVAGWNKPSIGNAVLASRIAPLRRLSASQGLTPLDGLISDTSLADAVVYPGKSMRLNGQRQGSDTKNHNRYQNDK
jgi:hypothetical protein